MIAINCRLPKRLSRVTDDAAIPATVTCVRLRTRRETAQTSGQRVITIIIIIMVLPGAPIIPGHILRAYADPYARLRIVRYDPGA